MTSSPRASPTRCCSSSRTRARWTSPSTTRFKPGLALLGPDQPARAAAVGACSTRCGCSPTRPRPARSPICPAAGRAGGGVRLARRALRQAGLAHGPPGVDDPRWLARAACAPARRAAAHRRGWRRDLLAGAPRRCALRAATGIPVAETQAGKGSLPYDHPHALGAIGATGTTAANPLAARGRRGPRGRHALQRLHDRVAQRLRRSRRAVRQPQRRVLRRIKHSATALVADARRELGWSRSVRPERLDRRPRRTGAGHGSLAREWDEAVQRRTTRGTSRCPRRAR